MKEANRVKDNIGDMVIDTMKQTCDIMSEPQKDHSEFLKEN